MTIEEPFNDFHSAVGHFPRAALEAAIAQREEIDEANEPVFQLRPIIKPA